MKHSSHLFAKRFPFSSGRSHCSPLSPKERGYVLVTILILITVATVIVAGILKLSIDSVKIGRYELDNTKNKYVAEGVLEEARNNILRNANAGVLPALIGDGSSWGANAGAFAPLIAAGRAMLVSELQTAYSGNPASPFYFDHAPLWKQTSDYSFKIYTLNNDLVATTGTHPNLGAGSADIRNYLIEVQATAAPQSALVKQLVEVRPNFLNYNLFINDFDVAPDFTFFGPLTMGGPVFINQMYTGAGDTRVKFDVSKGPITFLDKFISITDVDMAQDFTNGPNTLTFKPHDTYFGATDLFKTTAEVGSYINQVQNLVTTPPGGALEMDHEINKDVYVKIAPDPASPQTCIVTYFSDDKVTEISHFSTNPAILTGQLIYSPHNVNILGSEVDCKLTIAAQNITVRGSIKYKNIDQLTDPNFNGPKPTEQLGLFTYGRFTIDPQDAFSARFPGGSYDWSLHGQLPADQLFIDGIIITREFGLAGLENEGSNVFLDASGPHYDKLPPYGALGELKVWGMLFVAEKLKTTQVKVTANANPNLALNWIGITRSSYDYDNRLALMAPPGMPLVTGSTQFIVIPINESWVKF